jgi:alpha-L-rhamnosidase
MRSLLRLLLFVVPAVAQHTPQAPVNLQVENRVDPLGMDVTSPRLSWNIASELQTAYQVRAASNQGLLDSDLPDLWDSGIVVSRQSNNLVYGGTAMQSRARVLWQVRVWTDGNPAPSPWSATATWEMGLLNPSDWSAQWITNPSWTYGQPLPVFARPFSIAKPVSAARLYVTGLGAYVATLNGRPVTEDVLAPGNTRFAARVEYATYDVGALLTQGTNTLQVELGNGSYNAVVTPGHYMDFVNAASAPLMLIAQLEISYTDGTSDVIASDATWRTTLGPTIVSTWYGGEEYDARRLPAADLSTWDFAVAATPQGSALSWRPAPPVRIVRTVTPQSVSQPQAGVYVFDMGINFAGWFQLAVSGPAGTKVTMMIAEQLRADGTADQSQFYSPVNPVYPVVDTYTLSGNGVEVWHPKFAYHGFRYLQVTGLPNPPDVGTITGFVLRGANESGGAFASSNSLLNNIHQIIDRAIQSNMMSIFTDCPDREKLGWLADMQGIFDSIARNYDIAAYERTVVRNMTDAQTVSGLVPDFVPEYVVYDDGFRDDPNWGDAIILTPWSMYETYGDVRTLETNYPNMQRYLDYLTNKSSGNLLNYGLDDWISPDAALPMGVVATYAYYRSASTMSRIAEVLGKTEDSARYATLAQSIGDAFNVLYLDPVRRTYSGGGHQAADAVALDMGIVPADQRQAVLNDLIADIRARGNHLNVGIVSLGAVFRVLTAAGRDDVIYDIAVQTTNPSYGFQIVHGATSLAEAWDGPATGLGSQNHMMLGAIDEWFTAALAGIRQAPGTVGYASLIIKPAVVGDLTHVYGSYRTPNGLVESEWTRGDDGRLTFDVTIPGNTTATVLLPDARPARREVVNKVGPGRYRFIVRKTQ